MPFSCWRHSSTVPRRRGSLVWLISLRWAGLAARLQQRDKFGEGHAQAETDLGDDAHRWVGFPLFDLPDGFRGDLAVFRQAIPAQPCGLPDFRQLARQPGADAFGVVVGFMLTNWCCFHARRSPPNPPEKFKTKTPGLATLSPPDIEENAEDFFRRHLIVGWNCAGWLKLKTSKK